MDFCDNCGILLSAPVTGGAIPYCNPCRRMKELESQVGKGAGSSNKHMSKAKSNYDSELHIRGVGMSVSTSSKPVKSPSTSDKVQIPPGKVSGRENETSADSSGFTVVTRKKKSRKNQKEQDWPVSDKSFDSSEEQKDSALGDPQDEIKQQWCREQENYKQQLKIEDTPTVTRLVSGHRRKDDGSYFYIGGVDISFIVGNNIDACACLTVVQMPNLEVVYQRMEMIQLTQPYIPGFLAFREVPPLVQLYNCMQASAPQFTPDVIMVDGNGILHPRGFGLACQLGVILDIPTMGVAKTLMSAQGLVDDDKHKQKKKTLMEAGSGFELVSDSGNVLGMCLRVHDKAPNPVYISAGHKITLESAQWIILECSKYRIPEPVRKADLDSREYLRIGKTEPQEFIKDD